MLAVDRLAEDDLPTRTSDQIISDTNEDNDDGKISSEEEDGEISSDEEDGEVLSPETDNPRYLWCLCENSNVSVGSDLCRTCKLWFHKDCFLPDLKYNDEKDFDCFVCTKNEGLIKKYSMQLATRNKEQQIAVKSVEILSLSSSSSSSSSSINNLTDVETYKIPKGTKRNRLLNSSSTSSSNSGIEAVSSDSGDESKTLTSKKKPIDKKPKSTTNAINIQDLDINLKEKPSGITRNISQKQASCIPKMKESKSNNLTEKQKIENLKKRLKPSNQTKLMSQSKSLNKMKSNRHDNNQRSPQINSSNSRYNL